MKILFTRFPLESALKGGAELQTLSLMRGLIERGHTVAFAGSCPALLALCRENTIPTTEWDIGPPPVTGWHAVSFFWRKRHMRESLRELIGGFFQKGEKLDVVIMLSLSGKLLLTDIAADAGIRVFWIEHDRVGNWLRKNPWLPMLLKQSRKAKTIVVSKLSERIYKELGWHEKDLVTIPNGVDKGRLQSSSPLTPQPQSSNLQIGCIARLSPEKGIDLLIQAIAPLAGLHLEIVGEGKEEARLKAIAKASNIEDMITFTPFAEHVADVYRRIDLLVLPSREHDPFGLAAAEAMMLGLPVIVTDKCGIAGYINNEIDGLVVPADSAGLLREAIQRMQDAGIRQKIADEGKATAEKLFDLNKMVDAYEQVLKRS